MCNSIIPHLHIHIVLCVHNPKSSLIPLLFIPPLPSFTSPAYFPSYCCLCLHLRVFFINPFTQSPPSSPVTPVSLFSVAVDLFLLSLLVNFVLCSLQSGHMRARQDWAPASDMSSEEQEP